MFLPEKAAYWPKESILLVADLHLGKAATFQESGVPVPLHATEDTLSRLSTLVRRVQPSRVLILGDLWHAKAGMTGRTLASFARWKEEWSSLSIDLVLGNHDRKIDAPVHEKTGLCLKVDMRIGPFHFCHEPCERDEYCIGGHLHPGVRLVGAGRDSIKTPCFWVRPDMAVLPAFGAFTGISLISPEPGDQILIPIPA